MTIEIEKKTQQLAAHFTRFGQKLNAFFFFFQN